MVDRIVVYESFCFGNFVRAEFLTVQRRQFGFKVAHQLVGRVGRNTVEVKTQIIATAVFPPVFAGDFFHAFAGGGYDVEPEQNRPDAVFFADMAGAGAEAFLAAEGDAFGIHQVDEIFPAGRHFVIADVAGGGNAGYGGRGGH